MHNPIARLSKKTRLYIAIGLASCFFLAEVSVGFYTRSLALIADAFHVLFDLLSFSVALGAILVSRLAVFMRTGGVVYALSEWCMLIITCADIRKGKD